MVETATEIMFSYLVFIGFILVFISLTGQNFFGSAFPINPFTSATFAYTSPVCGGTDWVCILGSFFGQISKLIIIPFQIVSYMWAIFIFFMTSPILWWVGLILFFPAGVVFLYLLYPILIEIANILVGIAQAIANAIPF
jgi:hypothetical protein